MNAQSKKTKQETIKVCVRARPLLTHEDVVFWVINKEKNTICTLNNKDSMTYLSNNSENKDFKKALLDSIYLPQHFTFDKLYPETSTSEEIYKDIGKPIVRQVIRGYNGNIFMYGQTTSGKTYTMLGTPNAPGIIPCSLRDIFRQTDKTGDTEYSIFCSYIEIYNENIFDLLKEDNHSSLKIFEDTKFGVTATEAKKQLISTFEDAILLLNFGEENRRYRSTLFNEYSSRSHTIFQIFVEAETISQKNKNKDKNKNNYEEEIKQVPKKIFSCLNLVDLAGSERVTEHEGKENGSGETGYINKSLFVLGNVINKLAESKRYKNNLIYSGYVPYRDSKLTRLLSHGLGGNSLTTIICTISPASINYNQTLSTLRFATRAKKVHNHAKINERGKEDIEKFKKEINQLKNDLFKKNDKDLEIMNKILNTNEDISKELEIYKEKYENVKEKNFELKNELKQIKSNFGGFEENLNNKNKEKGILGLNKKLKVSLENSKKIDRNENNHQFNVSPLIHRPNKDGSNNTIESHFLDTTTKKIFANMPEKNTAKNSNQNMNNFNYDYQFFPQDENFFIDNLIKEYMSRGENSENILHMCKNLSHEYKNELLVLQNKFKDKFKEIVGGRENLDLVNFEENKSYKSVRSSNKEDSEFVLKMIENNTVFNNIELHFQMNNNEGYEFNAKLLKKIYDERLELIEKSFENYKNHLESFYRRKIQNLKNVESLTSSRPPILKITNEHNENLKTLRRLYEEKIEQIEKKFFDFLKKLTKDCEK